MNLINLHPTLVKSFKVTLLTSMKRARTSTGGVDTAVFNDLTFPRTFSGADYDTTWSECFHRNIFAVTSCYESTVLFAAREGWVNSQAPVCAQTKCIEKHNDISKRKSYIYNRIDGSGVALSQLQKASIYPTSLDVLQV